MKRIGPKTEPGGPHKSEVKESYYLCPVLQVGTEEGQGKITNTKNAFEATQKNAMIDCVEGSA